MNIHEYQAKKLLSTYGVPIMPGIAVTTLEQVEGAISELNKDNPSNPLWVVKAQIHAGGRGKAGGVILAKSQDAVKQGVEKLLGNTLVTHQTGPEGQLVRTVYIEQGSAIKQEFYLSIILNRKTSRLSVITSAAGGMNIEELAEKQPDSIHTISIEPSLGIQSCQIRKLCFALNLSEPLTKPFKELLDNLYKTFIETDATLIEINPLVLTPDNTFIALDAKISFDDNALFRHPNLETLRDKSEENPIEREAAQHDLSYIKLNGDIGCMVNGAGLAMATMDIIKLHGAQPANFLDVGGNANKEKVTIAFKLILSDPHVKAILVNIFGGIMQCDVIAEGIIAAAQEVNITVPMVVRLQGTNHEKGKQILSNSNLPFITADDLEDAAIKAVNAVQNSQSTLNSKS